MGEILLFHHPVDPTDRGGGVLCSAKFILVSANDSDKCFVAVCTLCRNVFPISFTVSERGLFITPFHKHPHDQDTIPLPRVRITGPAIPVVPAPVKSGSGGSGNGGEICRFYPNCSRGGACFYYHPPPTRSKPPPQPAHSRPMVKGQRPMPGSYKWTSAASRP